MSKKQVLPKVDTTPTVFELREYYLRSVLEVVARALRGAETQLECGMDHDAIVTAWLELGAHALNSVLPFAGNLGTRRK